MMPFGSCFMMLPAILAPWCPVSLVHVHLPLTITWESCSHRRAIKQKQTKRANMLYNM
jgi:hypothetical protein